MGKSGAPVSDFFAAFGDISDPNHQKMEPRDCGAEDCLNPCYGENHWGACNRCIYYMIANGLARSDVCDLCELGQESKPWSG